MKISEIFLSVNGETETQGQPTTFIRFQGCRLRCTWCDSMYTWQTGQGSEMGLMAVAKKIEELGCPRICITGGEPMEQPLAVDDLMRWIMIRYQQSKHPFAITNDYRRKTTLPHITIETGGHVGLLHFHRNMRHFLFPIVLSLDVKMPKSGMVKENRADNLDVLNQNDILKFVIEDELDFDFAMKFLEKNQPKAHIIFSPAYPGFKENVEEYRTRGRWLAEKVMENRLWTVRTQLQVHKLFWGPERRGV